MKTYLMSAVSLMLVLLLTAPLAMGQTITITGLTEQEAALTTSLLFTENINTLHPVRQGLPELAEPMPRIYYPIKAKEYAVEGRVLVVFTVDKGGLARDVEILNGPRYGCQDEVRRVVQLMRFKPILDEVGTPVAIRHLTTFDFRLD